jgi:hypothetical protein
MALKSLRYHYRCQFNESEGISIPHSNLSYCAELPECIAVSKLPGLDPVSGSAIVLHMVKSVVRAIPSSTETPECLPDIHEGPSNLAESNDIQ